MNLGCSNKCEKENGKCRMKFFVNYGWAMYVDALHRTNSIVTTETDG